jgi:hypothetical protein
VLPPSKCRTCTEDGGNRFLFLGVKHALKVKATGFCVLGRTCTEDGEYTPMCLRENMH